MRKKLYDCFLLFIATCLMATASYSGEFYDWLNVDQKDNVSYDYVTSLNHNQCYPQDYWEERYQKYPMLTEQWPSYLCPNKSGDQLYSLPSSKDEKLSHNMN